MISIVYENMVIRATVDDFPASPCKRSFVSKYDGKEVPDSYIFPSIILEEKKVKNFSPDENKYVALKSGMDQFGKSWCHWWTVIKVGANCGFWPPPFTAF